MPVYMADKPHIIPSYPAKCLMEALPVESPTANRIKSMVKEPNMNYKARFNLKVPKNKQKVKKPQIAR